MRMYAIMADFGDSNVVALMQNNPLRSANDPSTPSLPTFISPFNISITNNSITASTYDLKKLWQLVGQSGTLIGQKLAAYKYATAIGNVSMQVDSGTQILNYKNTSSVVYETYVRHGTSTQLWSADNIVFNQLEIPTNVNVNLIITGTIVIVPIS